VAARGSSAPRLKGSIIRSFVQWYEADVRPGGVREAAERLPAEQAEIFDLTRPDLGVLPNRWYDAAPLHNMLDMLIGGRDEQAQGALAKSCGEAMVAKMRGGVHRMVFDWFLTPGRYAKIVDWAWRLNYQDGHVHTEKLAPNRHKGIVVDWKGHHPFLCMTNVEIKRCMYESMGCADVRVESSYCIGRGDAQCGSIITWAQTRS